VGDSKVLPGSGSPKFPFAQREVGRIAGSQIPQDAEVNQGVPAAKHQRNAVREGCTARVATQQQKWESLT